MLLRAVAHSKENYQCWMPTCQHSKVSNIIDVAPFTPTTTTTTLANISPVRSLSLHFSSSSNKLMETLQVPALREVFKSGALVCQELLPPVLWSYCAGNYYRDN